MKEKVFYHEYTTGYGLTRIEVDKVTNDDEITILVRNLDLEPYSVINFLKYKNVGHEVDTWPRVSWKNLILCSGNYNVVPDYDYMHTAVQNGLKPVSTTCIDRDKIYKLRKHLPHGCKIVPYREERGMWMICMNGCLSDFLDFDMVKQAYVDHDCWDNIHWDRVRTYFDMPFVDFADMNKCPLELFCDMEIVIQGLALGYHVESTIALMKGDCMSPSQQNPSKTAEWRRADSYF